MQPSKRFYSFLYVRTADNYRYFEFLMSAPCLFVCVSSKQGKLGLFFLCFSTKYDICSDGKTSYLYKKCLFMVKSPCKLMAKRKTRYMKRPYIQILFRTLNAVPLKNLYIYYIFRYKYIYVWFNRRRNFIQLLPLLLVFILLKIKGIYLNNKKYKNIPQIIHYNNTNVYTISLYSHKNSYICSN